MLAAVSTGGKRSVSDRFSHSTVDSTETCAIDEWMLACSNQGMWRLL
jgi:hypothetical protein